MFLEKVGVRGILHNTCTMHLQCQHRREKKLIYLQSTNHIRNQNRSKSMTLPHCHSSPSLTIPKVHRPTDSHSQTSSPIPSSKPSFAPSSPYSFSSQLFPTAYLPLHPSPSPKPFSLNPIVNHFPHPLKNNHQLTKLGIQALRSPKHHFPLLFYRIPLPDLQKVVM